ncbi:duboraya isoform X2 [Genypterus blacodes]|uniref:duboraya isoform X2 n=1 Tax=Genypterus blacodes TaxID=154954 RepID=UPI003F76B57C
MEEKPVRRRPPRSLQLKVPTEQQEKPPDVTSPLPAKAKRNSALIEKLQANLVLSPTALLPSPMSPGLRFLPPSFTPPSPASTPSSAPVTAATTPSSVTPTSPTSPQGEEEGPASFEAPPTEGTKLLSINKSRARHSIRRRPPSRRHRESSTGDDVGVATEEASESEAKTAGKGGGEEEEGEVFSEGTKAEEMKDEASMFQVETGKQPEEEEQEEKNEGEEERDVKMEEHLDTKPGEEEEDGPGQIANGKEEEKQPVLKT